MKLIIKILSILVLFLLSIGIYLSFFNTSVQEPNNLNNEEISTSITYQNNASDGTRAIAEKYIGTSIDSFVITNSETDEEIDICDIDGIKIIEVYSSYCPVCLEGLPYVRDFINEYKDDLNVFIVAKEFNTKEKGLFTSKINDSNIPYYYVPGELNPLYGKLYNNAKPAYIVINEENIITEVSDGSFKNHSADEIFGTLDSILNKGGE